MPQSEVEILIPKLRVERPDLFDLYEQATRVVQRLKDALVHGPYPGLDSGRPDLYKAFGWRFGSWLVLRAA